MAEDERFTSWSGRYRLLEFDHAPMIVRLRDRALLVPDDPEGERLDDALGVLWECYTMLPPDRRDVDGLPYVARELDRIADDFAQWFMSAEQIEADYQARINRFTPMFDDLDEQDNDPKETHG